MATAEEPKAPGKARPENYAELKTQALDAVQYCLDRVPIQCLSEIDVAEKAVNHLRDLLIDDLRQPETSLPADVLRDALTRSNTALSMIVGIEYPATGSQRKMLEMTRDTLRDIKL